MARKSDPAIPKRILEEAEHVFHIKGYSAASMDEIAKACKMTKANLFHHFGSKDKLALAVLDFKIAEFRALKVEPLCSSEAAPEETITKLFEEAAKFFGGNGCRAGCFVGNIALEMSDQSEVFRERVSRFFADWADSTAKCLERWKSSGYFASSLDSRGAAEALAALYEGAMMLSRARRDPEIFRRVGPVARSILEIHKSVKRRAHPMGPKSGNGGCGC